MKFVKFEYQIKVTVEFSETDIDLLLECAKNHYDGQCRIAAQIASEGVHGNGFIAQLKLFPGPKIWSFNELDIANKCLERIPHTALRSSILRIIDEINDKTNQINNVK